MKQVKRNKEAFKNHTKLGHGSWKRESRRVKNEVPEVPGTDPGGSQESLKGISVSEDSGKAPEAICITFWFKYL